MPVLAWRGPIVEALEVTNTQPGDRDALADGSNAGLCSREFYHGTRADLKPGDLIERGYRSNFGKRLRAGYVYLTGALDTAVWGAELASGEGPGRIYMVEPTGPIEDDPNHTDKKLPGNPTQSFRSLEPLRVTGECTGWQGHPAERVQAMKDLIAGLEPLEGS